MQKQEDQSGEPVRAGNNKDNTEKDMKLVNINSVQFNKKHSVLTTKSKTSSDQNSIIVPYKIDTGRNGNIMPEHIFKKSVTKDYKEAVGYNKNKHVILKTYNKTTITQLGTCTVLVEHKNNKTKCRFIVVPRNGKALFGMPGTGKLKIINTNIHSIGVEDAGDSEWCANTHTHTHTHYAGVQPSAGNTQC